MTGEHDPHPISRRVVEAVADEREMDPLELEPLYRVVDPECLDGIFRGGPSLAGQDAHRIEFTFGGCRVTVTGDGSVAVSPIDDGTTTSTGDGSPIGSSGVPESPD